MPRLLEGVLSSCGVKNERSAGREWRGVIHSNLSLDVHSSRASILKADTRAVSIEASGEFGERAPPFRLEGTCRGLEGILVDSLVDVVPDVGKISGKLVDERRK